jgi:hypothetical protein
MRAGARILSLLIAIFIAGTTAFAAPIAFREASHGGTSGEWWIVADGEITNDTPAQLKAFLKRRGLRPGSGIELYLNSRGGNLAAAIELGETIREFGRATRVARSVPNGLTHNGHVFEDEAPGTCHSACAVAFLGGTSRIATERTLGIDRRYLDDVLRQRDAAQTIARLADYVGRMGVDARFLGRGSAAPQDLGLFSAEDMRQLAITRDALEYGEWRLAPRQDGLVAMSTTRNGENEATLFCTKDGALRLAISMPHDSPGADVDGLVRGATVFLFGVEIPQRDISARSEAGRLSFEFRLPGWHKLGDGDAPPGTDPRRMRMTAVGSTRFMFDHELPHRNFLTFAKYVGRNCI